jgi:hypothetical protein
MEGTHLRTGNADLEEIGILRGVLLVDLTSISTEGLVENPQVLRRLHHQLARLALLDFDVTFKNRRVAEAKGKGSNGHGLRDGTEVEDALLAQTSKVEETLLRMTQCVENHLGAAVQCSVTILWLEEILKVGDVLGPNFFGPELSTVVEVLTDIANDVGLLQEKTHGSI